MEKKLDVKNLRISFRTPSGKVQAVRGIDFELYKGETLAIVGESGSGKSVTSKAILGILAGNSIIEGGEIIYDGQDLLQISEDDFYRLRGDKVAMIFQDPLSSLNPIMRIGKQLTEAMILKGKARQKSSRLNFNNTLSTLNKYMIAACGKEREAELTEKCKNFDKFEFKHIELEKAYDEAKEFATEALEDIEEALFLIEKSAFKDAKNILAEICQDALLSFNDYVISGADVDAVKKNVETVKSNMKAEIKSGNYVTIAPALTSIQSILKTSLEKGAPNFFSMGYYMTFAGQPLPNMPVDELNVFLRKYLDDNFMLAFIDDAEKALTYSYKFFDKEKDDVIRVLKDSVDTLSAGILDRKEMDKLVETLSREVKESINPLEIHKDSLAYTFNSSLKTAVAKYFQGIDKNKIEERRYAKQKAKYDALAAKGKAPDWKVTPAAVIDLDLAKENIVHIMTRLLDHYTTQLEINKTRDFHADTVAIIDYLKLNASGVVRKVTKDAAKHKALKLLKEVGISEPRRRYKQYPFEFSGGMRQRIVIAIALAADPDILICDEPTTALDVTIQAQILELINDLKRERQLSVIFITHDLGVVANMADRIAVMYAGKIVEYGTANDVFYDPAHPYTWALLSSMPDLDTNEKLEAIPGTPPNMIYPPVGDAFADRNKYALKIDFEMQPPMFQISETHSAATWLLHPDAPKVEVPKIVTDRIARMKKLGGADHAE